MILKKKKLLVITSLLTLLPIPIGLLLWNQFPETMAIHFGLNGLADGFATSSYAIFVPPVLMLAVHWVCILVNAFDKRNADRNQKMQKLVLWIVPALSILSSCGIYALALDVEFSPTAWTLIIMGLLFAILGNYMPKTRMNPTMGIKVWWAYTSDENWNATHRFAGKLWVVGGLILALCFWLPNLWAMVMMFVILIVISVLPILYSRNFYKKELAAGKELKNPRASMSKRAKRLSGAGLALVIIFMCVILFCGNITYAFQEEYVVIDSNMYTPYTLRYEKTESLEFREGNVSGMRVGGYGSFRLLMGFFENEEFGTYIRYTYYDPKACVVVSTAGKTLVLSAETYEETQKLYENLLVLTGQ